MSSPPEATPHTEIRVLLVDDDAAKRLAITAALTPLGITVIETDSGVGALRCIMEHDFAVILLDVRMPGMDGFETAARIRQSPRSELTPIIFITAYTSDELVTTDRYAEGAADFLFAPVPPVQLRAKVSAFVNLHQRAEALAAQAGAMQRSADQMRLLTDSAPIGIFQTDTENRYVYTNSRWSEITGLAAGDAAGQSWSSVFEGGDMRQTDGDGGELSCRFDIAGHSGPRVVVATSRPISGADGEPTGWVGTLADITAETQAETSLSVARDDANAASQLKSDFLANMSHEIRTPMNGVLGMTEILLETDLDPRQREYAQTVYHSGEALLTIINDILDFSKVEAGRIELKAVPFDIRAVVEDVVDLLARPALDKGLEVITLVEPSVPVVVSGDPGRVRQVLTNLIGNAVKFTHAGEIETRVSATPVSDGCSVLRFEISDTGAGIDADKLELVFEPFMQADTSTSRKYEGTGLGLAISSQLVALMGGQRGVDSTVEVGSTFWFTIPVAALAGQPPAPGRTPDPDLAGHTALVVESSATQRAVTSGYLTDWGMRVIHAESASTAMLALGTANADGISVTAALVDQPMALPVAIMTVAKPVRPARLHESLRALLGLGHDDPAVAHQPVQEHPRRRDAGRLLLAEDNLINQKVALAMLRGAGYRVDAVANGAAAVEAAAAQHYDAILMDCQMPERNGYEATAAIRAQEDFSRHTPIIAMTAGARPEDRARCLASGMDDYIAKPVRKAALLAVVSRALCTVSIAPGRPRSAVDAAAEAPAQS